MATAFEAAPWLIVISRHRGLVFTVVASLLALNYWVAIVRPRRMNCAPGELCHVDSFAMRVNRMIFWASVAVYAGAVTVTYGALWWVRGQT